MFVPILTKKLAKLQHTVHTAVMLSEKIDSLLNQHSVMVKGNNMLCLVSSLRLTNVQLIAVLSF